MSNQTDNTTIQESVRNRYAQVAQNALNTTGSKNNNCCGSACCGGEQDPISANIYTQDELAGAPVAAVLASLGCGNPTALASLREGEIVLDLGSGGGIDVFLSARRVGPSGFVYGLDMTDEMLELAERNRKQADSNNVQFLKGTIEEIPLPDATVHVIISNCVINLSVDKAKVLRESFRVLKPGGRFAVSDVVILGHIPEYARQFRQSLEAWAGCIAGALEDGEYRDLLSAAGFTDIEIEVTRRYSAQDAIAGGADFSDISESDRAKLDGLFAGAFIRARKP